MAKNVAIVFGVVFLLAGIVGFINPTLMGMHLTPLHNVIHLATGLIALYFGARGRNVKAAKAFLIVFGAFYGLLGVAGFLAGGGTPTVPPMAPDQNFLPLLPNQLEMTTADHTFHVIAGVIAFVVGLLQRTEAPAGMHRERAMAR